MARSQSVGVRVAFLWMAWALTGCGASVGVQGASGARPSLDATDEGDAAPPYQGGYDPNDGQVLGPIQDPTAPQRDACAEVAVCPAGFACGRYIDPCSGRVVACGSPCHSGSVCVRDPNDPTSQKCEPKACAGRCGAVGLDGCGVPIGCGGCPSGQDCVGNLCVPAGPPPASTDGGRCASLSCTPDSQTHLCGSVTDGCGNTRTCSCPSGQTCSGGVCGAPPPECARVDGGTLCGSVSNACGSASVSCGGCPGGQCVQNACTTCAPLSCGIETCGLLKNPCGETLLCGTCDGGSCYQGQCCTPSTCAEAADGGPPDCAPVNLGCGVTKSCSPCHEGEICANHKCVACAPKTCSDFGSAGCGHSDACGKTVDCCAQGTTCQGSICCAAGEVAYGGTCCLPSCDAAQPPGVQVSCGQVIVCAPGVSGPPR